MVLASASRWPSAPGLFNIGAQGQLILGAICAGYVGFTWNLPPGLHLLVALLAGLAGGAFWAGWSASSRPAPAPTR